MGLPNMKKYTDDMKIETEIGVGPRSRWKYYLGEHVPGGTGKSAAGVQHANGTNDSWR